MKRQTGFGRADRFLAGLEELQEETQSLTGWFDMSEVALRACMKDEGYMRMRRTANKVLGVLGIDRSDAPTKAPYLMYGGPEAYGAVRILEEAGLAAGSYDYDAVMLIPTETPSEEQSPRLDRSGPHLM